MSSTSTLNGDVEVPVKLEEPKEQEQLTVVSAAAGPTKDFFVLPIPRRLQYSPEKPFVFGLAMNWGLSFAATFLISNLYYCQPLLIQMAKTFDVSYEEVSKIATLIQTGFAVGIFFILPLGDLVRRRQLLLLLIFTTASLTIGLATVKTLQGFQILSFLLGVANASPQILVPLAADLAPPGRRGFAYSIVLIGMIGGQLLARVLAGVIAEFASWRVVYYMAIGAQYFIVVMCYFIIPDYPAKNKNMTYPAILLSMLKFAFTEPLMVQIELMAIATSACFAAYWVTLTFLLGGPPYNYSTLVIGLFGLLGLSGMAMGPLVGRVIDRFAAWYGILIGSILLLVFQSVQTAAGGISIVAVIVACIGLDGVRQVQNVSIVTCMFSIDMAAASRLNALFVLSYYIGQLTGTSVGTTVFVEHGWRACALLGMALYGFQVFILLLRGPHCSRKTWFGYEGGWALFKKHDHDAM
ncbi:MFS general substrate transporter [Pholiota conissans]|uniref:MFS general substrate transporter n=1 Tax=Pholiota conissans TaxID=109636 RepID=A0A9P6CV93_9AGAR|nr:MFS general substrate transporter [Pholiota conissans]